MRILNMHRKKQISILALSLLSVGCISNQPISSNEKWHNFGLKTAIATEALPAEQSMVVIIREQGTVKGAAVNVFVDGKYLTSLQDGGYKSIPLCAVPTSLTAAFTDINLNYQSLRGQKNVFDLSQSRIHYFSVTQTENDQILLKPLTTAQAQQVISTAKEQVNTLPRVEKKYACPKVVYQQIQAPQANVKKYTLAASALFAYSKSGPKNLLPQAQHEVATIAAEIQKNAKNIGQIAVIGYTDPVGSESYNQQLSLQRAETVKNMLIQHGVSGPNILAEGRGKRELLVSDCDSRFVNNKIARDECNLPNRRVEIVTYSFTAE